MIKNSISVLIVEKQTESRNWLLQSIREDSRLYIADIVETGEKAYYKLRKENYDLVFFDTYLPDMSSFELIEKLDRPPGAIFVTTNKEMATKAFEIGSIDYIIKPCSKERFKKAIDRYEKMNNYAQHSKNAPLENFTFKQEGKIYILPFSEIYFFSSERKKSTMHVRQNIFAIKENLKSIEGKLPRTNFFRNHKSYIINLGYLYQFAPSVGGQYTVAILGA